MIVMAHGGLLLPYPLGGKALPPIGRQSELYSSWLQWPSCRVSIGNEASRGRSQVWQSPPWSLSPKGAI